MSSNADDQAAWRERQLAAGRKPRTFYLEENTLALLRQQAQQRGINQHQTIDHIIQGAPMPPELPTSWNPQEPICETNRPPGVSDKELPEIAAMQSATLVEQQMEREANWNGGAAPEGELTQKQRVEASFLAGNMHRQGK